jgi:hypothetical protein
MIKGLDPNPPTNDSGVEYIGEIPKHWKTVKLKFVCTINPPKSVLQWEQDSIACQILGLRSQQKLRYTYEMQRVAVKEEQIEQFNLPVEKWPTLFAFRIPC